MQPTVTVTRQTREGLGEVKEACNLEANPLMFPFLLKKIEILHT